MQDAWRAYLELAFGLTEASRKKAKEVARDLVGKGGATAAQVQAFAEELVSTSKNNREELARLVRYEVDRTLGAVGLATAEEVAELTGRVQELERRLREPSSTTAPTATATKAPARQAPAKRAPAKKATAKQAPAKTTTKTTAKKARAKKTATRQAGAGEAGR